LYGLTGPWRLNLRPITLDAFQQKSLLSFEKGGSAKLLVLLIKVYGRNNTVEVVYSIELNKAKGVGVSFISL